MDTAVISYSYMFMADLMGKQQYIGNDRPENRPFSQNQFFRSVCDSMPLYGLECTKYQACHRTFHNKIHLIRPGCLRPSTAVTVQKRGLKHQSFILACHPFPATNISWEILSRSRMGRDWQLAEATLFYNNSDVRPNCPGIIKEMIRYCKQNAFILASFVQN